MLRGILFALSACFIWGLIFIVPQFMTGFSPLEIALGRYAFYSLISLPIFLHKKMQGTCRYGLQIWIKALGLSLLPSFAYYIFVVLSLRYSTPAICAMILGISPITTAFYGNWKRKECTFKSLILPSVLVLIGLVIINVPSVLSTQSPSTYMLGLGCAFIALASWSWYVVTNAQFLKNNPEVKSSDWATVIGVATSFWVLLFGAVFIFFASESFELQKYTIFSESLAHFLVGTWILGLFCSWVGGTFWNRASTQLPVSLAGQLTIFETIFGLIFVYAFNQHLPPLFECIGIVFLLAAIICGIQRAAKNPQEIVHF